LLFHFALFAYRLNGILLYEVSMERRHDLRVPVLPEEMEAIKLNAKNAGLSVAAYLRNVGIGYKITGVVDANEVEKLLKVNGDLGRVGGLLKLWLTNDIKTRQFGYSHIANVLHKIEAAQSDMRKIMKLVVQPKAK
jgi:hypothetical protein